MTSRRSHRLLAGLVVLGVVVAGASSAGAGAGVPSASAATSVARSRSAPISQVGQLPVPPPREAATGRSAAPAKVTLPAPQRASVVPVAGRMVRAGTSPVMVGAVRDGVGRALTGAVGVEVLARAEVQRLGGQLVGVRVVPAVGARSVQVAVDYSSFAHAYGGNYSARLALFTIPACAASTPTGPACRPRAPS
jgi:hypothetical protein